MEFTLCAQSLTTIITGKTFNSERNFIDTNFLFFVIDYANICLVLWSSLLTNFVLVFLVFTMKHGYWLPISFSTYQGTEIKFLFIIKYT